jgi:nucleoside-diphosphate-sugar epimerase
VTNVRRFPGVEGGQRVDPLAWWRERRVCVTGGTGLIGRHLVSRLSAEAAEVVSYARSPAATRHKAIDREGSILDFAALCRAVRDCSVVVHLAAETRRDSEVRTSDYFEVNVRGTSCVLRACESENVDTFVYASTGYVYGAARELPITEDHATLPTGAYASSKLAGEHLVARYAQKGQHTAIIARLGNVYASDSGRDTVIGQAFSQVARGRMAFRDYSPVRDFIHVDDVVEAMLRLPPSVGRGCTVVNVSTSEGASIGELAMMVADLALALGLGEVRLDPRTVGTTDPIPAIVLDNTRLRALTGWRPAISLEQGLHRVLQETTAATAPPSYE